MEGDTGLLKEKMDYYFHWILTGSMIGIQDNYP